MFIVIHVIYNSTEVDKGVNLKLVHRRRILKTASRKPLKLQLFLSFLPTGMTTWFAVPLNTALLLIVWIPLLIPIFYSFMDKKDRTVSKATSYEGIHYSPLNSNPQELKYNLTFRDKFEVIWNNALLFISLFIGVFGMYIGMQAVVTTLAFSNAPFPPRDHYQYYIFAVMAGELLGSSYGLVMLCLKCSLPDSTKHTWVFALFIMTAVFFLVFAAWFRFLQNVWIVLGVLFAVGLNNGALFNCTFAVAAASQSSSRHKGFSRAFLMTAQGAGVLAAALLGQYIEPLMKEHCVFISKDATNCLTRLMD